MLYIFSSLVFKQQNFMVTGIVNHCDGKKREMFFFFGGNCVLLFYIKCNKKKLKLK